MSVFKNSKPKAPQPPGSFKARHINNLVAFTRLCWRANKFMIVQDLLGIGKKLKKLQVRSGEVAVITGAARGIGFDALKKLLQYDFKVIIGVRDLDAGEIAIKQIRDAEVSTGSAVILKLDLKSLNSVRIFAKEVLKETQRIDILINNAGIMLGPYEITEDGYESQFQVNYLGHFLLTNLLLERIKATSTIKETSCRIVNVSSDAYYMSNLKFKNVETPKVYSGLKAYGDSKMAQVLHAKYLDNKMSMEGCNVRAYALHPGLIASNLWANLSGGNLLTKCFQYWCKSTENGADVIIFAAMSPKLENEGGVYINNCKKIKADPRAKNVNLQSLVWEKSIQLSEKWRFRRFDGEV